MTPIDLPAFVIELAVNKAREVAGRTCIDLTASTVVAADTLVTVQDSDFGVPLGKPVDAADAYRMLRALSGRTHRVYTGLAVIGETNERHLKTTAVCTRVRFRELDDAMIADYIATGEPMDKAGAYGAQGYAAPFIESFDGDFFNVVGLPLHTLGAVLEELGIEWSRYRRNLPDMKIK